MLRAREPKLLNRERAERLISAENAAEAARLLTELGYEDMSLMTAGEIEQALSERRNTIFDEIDRFCPDREITDLFRLRYDYHNAKAVLKAEAVGSDASGLLSRSGRVAPDELQRLCREDGFRFLPGSLGAAAREAKAVLARSANPQEADFVLDRAYFSDLCTIAEKSGNAFLKDYTALLIDTANLKSVVRTFRMGKTCDFLRGALVPGGKADVAAILSAGDTEKILPLFGRAGLGKVCEKAGDVVTGGRMTDFELACDNALNGFIKNAGRFTYGSEPVAAYLAAVENEIMSVRMILTGKLAGIRSEILRERLRDLYA